MRAYEKSINKKVDYRKCFVSIMRKSIHDFIDMILDIEKNNLWVQTPKIGIVIPVTANWEINGETSQKLINQCFEEKKEFADMIENSNEDFPEGNIKVVDTSKSEFATVILASTPLWKTAKDKIKSSYAMERLIDEIIKSSIKKDLGMRTTYI